MSVSNLKDSLMNKMVINELSAEDICLRGTSLVSDDVNHEVTLTPVGMYITSPGGIDLDPVRVYFHRHNDGCTIQVDQMSKLGMTNVPKDGYWRLTLPDGLMTTLGMHTATPKGCTGNAIIDDVMHGVRCSMNFNTSELSIYNADCGSASFTYNERVTIFPFQLSYYKNIAAG